MSSSTIPDIVFNWINGEQRSARSGLVLDKLNPVNGKKICKIARSGEEDVRDAVKAALRAQPGWAETPAVTRGSVLHDLVLGMKKCREEIAGVVALETGKSMKDALGETDGAIALGLFFAGEGQRLYGKDGN